MDLRSLGRRLRQQLDALDASRWGITNEPVKIGFLRLLTMLGTPPHLSHKHDRIHMVDVDAYGGNAVKDLVNHGDNHVDHTDCILEMGFDEGPVITQGTQEFLVQVLPMISDVEWPTPVVNNIDVEWTAWPKRATVPNTNSQESNKRKLVSKGGKGKHPKQPPPTNYTGPNLHGLPEDPLIKKFKTIIGGVQMCSEAFRKNGHFVYTKGALAEEREHAQRMATTNRVNAQMDAEVNAYVDIEMDPTRVYSKEDDKLDDQVDE